jgi:ATP phosphoribosyltransferase
MPDDASLTLGLPKGSLERATFDLMARAGYDVEEASRADVRRTSAPDLTVIMFRAQELSRYVDDGVLDAALTGKDWIEENRSRVHVVRDLVYSKARMVPVRWVLAVADESPVERPEDLAGGLVATELVGVTKRYFKNLGVDAKVENSWGSTEIKARFPGVDAIVDVTETGSTLRANRLREIATVMESNTQFIANRDAWKDPAKRDRIENLAVLLQGAIDARAMVGLKMNVRKADWEERIMPLLPAERSPTLSHLAEEDWYAVEVVLSTARERELVPQLKKAGATGIIVYPLNKVIH